MASIVVTSNLLLGATDSGRWDGGNNSTWDESIRMLESSIDLARETKSQAVFIVGNLFDSSRPPAEIVMRATKALSSLPRGVHVYVIDGVRDVSGLKSGHISPAKAFLDPTNNKVHVISEPKVVDIKGSKILCVPHPRRGEEADFSLYDESDGGLQAVLSAAPIEVSQTGDFDDPRDSSLDHSTWSNVRWFSSSDETFFATGNSLVSELPSIGSPFPLTEDDASSSHTFTLVTLNDDKTFSTEVIDTGHREIATLDVYSNDDAVDLFDWAMNGPDTAPEVITVRVPLSGPSREVESAVTELRDGGVDIKVKRVFPDEPIDGSRSEVSAESNEDAAQAYLQATFPDDEERQSRVMSVIRRAMRQQ